MPVHMTCPSCDSRLKVPDQIAGSGKLLKCPRCAEKIPLGDTRRKAANTRAEIPRSKDAPPEPPPVPREKKAKRPRQADAPTAALLDETS